MLYILFDTCIWLTLATKAESRPLLKKILVGLNENKFKLLLSDITIDEYERNKSRNISQYTKSFKSLIKNAKILYEDLDTSERETFLLLLNKANKNHETSAKQSINVLGIIERIFNHSHTINLYCSNEILIRAAKIALAKKAPCHRDKNSVADTVIYIQFEEWVKKHIMLDDEVEFHFVTENFKDFSSSQDNRKPHEDLVIFNNDKVFYHINTETATERINFTNIIPDEFDLFESLLRLPRYSSSLCTSIDGHNFDKNQGRWSPSEFGGLSWHLICTRCGALENTGDFYD